jgi:hypothetical protein
MKPSIEGFNVPKGRPPLLDIMRLRFVTSVASGANLSAHNASFRRTLCADDKSERTVRS